MYRNLKDKNIVIIDETSRIGFSASKAFVENWAQVVIVGRDDMPELLEFL